MIWSAVLLLLFFFLNGCCCYLNSCQAATTRRLSNFTSQPHVHVPMFKATYYEPLLLCPMPHLCTLDIPLSSTCSIFIASVFSYNVGYRPCLVIIHILIFIIQLFLLFFWWINFSYYWLPTNSLTFGFFHQEKKNKKLTFGSKIATKRFFLLLFIRNVFFGRYYS